jgi:hypothetical protein
LGRTKTFRFCGRASLFVSWQRNQFSFESEHSHPMMKSAKFLKVVVLSLSIFSARAFAQSGDTTNGSTVLVDIDGAKVTMADFERKHPSGLFNARNSFYEAERKAVEQFVDEYLLERQAQKENLTVSELLKKHVDDTLPKDPSDEALRVYY